VLRSLDSATCDACARPAVTVLAIARKETGELLRAVCSDHLELALRGARPLSTAAPAPEGAAVFGESSWPSCR
jgi:hypothetical protein